MKVMILSDGEAFATLTVILMLVPVFILACGFYCIHLMKRKGYSLPVLWFFCGFFLNIIGILICGLMPEMNTAANPNVPIQHYDPQYQPANQPPYPNGQYQPPQQETYQPPYQSSYQDVPYDVSYDDGSIEQVQCAVCPSCGMINPPSSATCSSCGSKL